MADKNNNNNSNNKDECVGTLLVHQSDVQELSDAVAPDHSRDECVGTLLVHQQDVQELSDAPPASNLARRVTERVTKAIENTEHIDPDDDILNWQCDV